MSIDDTNLIHNPNPWYSVRFPGDFGIFTKLLQSGEAPLDANLLV
jgi:hypothetical protein